MNYILTYFLGMIVAIFLSLFLLKNQIMDAKDEEEIFNIVSKYEVIIIFISLLIFAFFMKEYSFKETLVISCLWVLFSLLADVFAFINIEHKPKKAFFICFINYLLIFCIPFIVFYI